MFEKRSATTPQCIKDIKVQKHLGSSSESVSQRYGSEDPDPHPDLHPDPYQNVMAPEHCLNPDPGTGVFPRFGPVKEVNMRHSSVHKNKL